MSFKLMNQEHDLASSELEDLLASIQPLFNENSGVSGSLSASVTFDEDDFGQRVLTGTSNSPQRSPHRARRKRESLSVSPHHFKRAGKQASGISDDLADEDGSSPLSRRSPRQKRGPAETPGVAHSPLRKHRSGEGAAPTRARSFRHRLPLDESQKEGAASTRARQSPPRRVHGTM
eukprot:Hpha_TRINITY_DN15098_c1_g1::TRINITY_DN15098_c1_g1_i2::g.125315::m.125315